MSAGAILAAMVPASVSGLWFYAGHAWSHALRQRDPWVWVDRAVVPEHYQAIETQLERLVFRARMAGPGFISFDAGVFTYAGVKVAFQMQCIGAQFATAADADGHRGGAA